MMSNDKRQDAREFAEATIPLLMDFTRNLQEIAKELLELRDPVKGQANNGNLQYTRCFVEANRRRLARLSPTVDRMARTTSQWIQHSDLDEGTRLALEARLAELEAMREYVDEVVYGAWDDATV